MPPTIELGQFHIHRGDADPDRLDLLTVERPRHTVVIPWPAA